MPEDAFPDILGTAIEDVFSRYCRAEIVLESEADLQGYIFARCLDLMRAIPGPHPVRLHACFPLGARRKPDLVIAKRRRDTDGALYLSVAELKFEPGSGDPEKHVAASRGEVVFHEEIAKDLTNLRDLVLTGPFRIGHLAVIDEKGTHRRAKILRDLPWAEVSLGGATRYLVHYVLRRNAEKSA